MMDHALVNDLIQEYSEEVAAAKAKFCKGLRDLGYVYLDLTGQYKGFEAIASQRLIGQARAAGCSDGDRLLRFIQYYLWQAEAGTTAPGQAFIIG